MKKIFTVTLFSVAIFLMSSCVSTVSKNNHQVSINHTAPVANLTITDKKGVEVYQSMTAASRKLKERTEFLSKDRYQVKFEKEGYYSKSVPVEFKSEGWYFGSILLGTDIGLLIVDPVNGDMYKLESGFFNEKLILSTASVEKEEFKVFGINEIPTEWKRHLVSLDNYNE